jgi:hypothetical protein
MDGFSTPGSPNSAIHCSRVIFSTIYSPDVPVAMS